MDKLVSMPVGIVVERRELNNRWQKIAWKPIGVLPGAGPVDGSKVLLSGEGWTHFHMATLPLELHRKETLAYKTNLNVNPPRLFVVLRINDDPAVKDDVSPFLVTASAFQAQDYLDAGDDIVEGVVMPDAIVAWVQAFCDHHHVDEPFKKRKRKRYNPDDVGFGRREDGHGAQRSGGGNGRA